MKTGILRKIVSGGQTGADRAALDWAISRGVPHGGWCPKVRKAEEGVIPPQYQLTEMTSSDYPSRTEQNVLDSDGTVMISIEAALGSRESALTQRLAEKHHKPWLHVHSGQLGPGETLRSFVAMHRIQTLNVAGPRASSEPRIAEFVRLVLSVKPVHSGSSKKIRLNAPLVSPARSFKNPESHAWHQR